MVASRTMKTSKPACRISPMASAMRSDSESDSLMAFPSSCIKTFRLSSTMCLLSLGQPSARLSRYKMHFKCHPFLSFDIRVTTRPRLRPAYHRCRSDYSNDVGSYSQGHWRAQQHASKKKARLEYIL